MLGNTETLNKPLPPLCQSRNECIRSRLMGFPPPVCPGRIKSIQLEYTEARRTLTNALRKAPQHTAVGFKQTVSPAPRACMGRGSAYMCSSYNLELILFALKDSPGLGKHTIVSPGFTYQCAPVSTESLDKIKVNPH